MIDDIGHFIGRKPDIDGNQGGAEQRNRIMGFQHGWRIGTDEGDLVTPANAKGLEAIGQTKHPLLEPCPGKGFIPINDCGFIRIDFYASIKKIGGA